MIKRLLGVVISLCLIGGYGFFHLPKTPEPIPSKWIKIDSDGASVQPWAGPWSCVLDTSTGLLWEIKTDDEGVHDADGTYSWSQDGVGESNQGDCYFDADRCDTADLVQQSNMEQLCGQANWRLPTVQELSSLIQEPTSPGEPAIDSYFFPLTKHGDYWTSASNQTLTGVYRHLNKGAVAINFSEGKEIIIPYRNAAFVMLVSSFDKKTP